MYLHYGMLPINLEGIHRVVEVVQRVVFGDPDEVLKLLGASGGLHQYRIYGTAQPHLSQLSCKVCAERHELQQKKEGAFKGGRLFPCMVQRMSCHISHCTAFS